MKRSIQTLILGLLALSPAQAQDGLAFFESQVLPVLQQRCYECHSHEKKIKGGLALDLRKGWETGGDNGPAVTPGKPDHSLLIKAVRYSDPEVEMPPKGKLPASEIAVLEKWVAMGAPDSRVKEVATAGKPRPMTLEEGRKFWAFQPVKPVRTPQTNDASWPLNAIDRFVLAGLERASLHPVAESSRYTWLRRVSLDLTGLPPTAEQTHAFVQDASAQAYERVVDRLLNSRTFGERWARHWLDLTGYADQIGTSNNVFAEHAWRYRDYVINAFNTDKPFNRFLREQIAGDLLPSASVQERADNLAATGFLVLGDVEIVAVDKLKMEVDLVDQQVSKVGTAFMGMTLACVRCHDHKFDPVSQHDYYALAGIFRSTDSTYKTDNGVWSSVNSVDMPETPAQTERRLQRALENETRLKDLQTQVEAAEKERAALEASLDKAVAAEKPALEKQRDERSAKAKGLRSEIDHAKFFAPRVARTFAVHDVEQPEDMRVTIRGNPYALGDRVARGIMRVAAWADMAPIPAGQSGRAQLADWLADPRHPLTARVTVNRIWQKLMGEGLVRTVDYFGTRGEQPTHPELLDYLAGRFVKEGWSQKALIRDIVLSRTYRLSSAHVVAAFTKDPENRLLWRMNRQRLDAEAIRDAMLAVSGTLAVSEGGPSLPLEYPVNVTSLSPKAVNPPAFNLRQFRPVQEYQRTIYLPVIRSSGQPGPAKLRDVFDFTQPAQMAGKRTETAVPTQALFLINGDSLRSRATELARLLLQQPGDDSARLQSLWLRALTRPVQKAEQEDALQFLQSVRVSSAKDADLTAWTELCHALLGSNEFLLRL